MKKIIDGLRYDTEKAIKVGEADNINQGVDSRSDFAYWEATLYQTPRSKRFFIAGAGGPASRFAQSVGQNSWSGGADLIPLTDTEALAWAERHLDTETCEKFFTIEDA